jgi:UDP-4-amino-4,6-dideoxy-L-N-acetyl-beta-L-altrosamine transaminase
LNVNHPQSNGKTIVVPVHFSGIPVDVQAIEAAVSDYRTVIIEDAAHAIGSCYKDGSKVGSCQWSQMAVFSFHPAKTMTTGEGGMVTTNDPELYHRLRIFRDNGKEKDAPYISQPAAPGYYEVQFLSGNYNFTEMQAALGLSQFQRLEAFIQRRQQLMQLYRDQLSAFAHVRLFDVPHEHPIAYHLCVAQIDFAAYGKTREAVMAALHERGIGTQVHYIPLYRHPFFKELAGDISEYFPEMETYYAQALSLPLYYHLKDEDVERVVSTLKRVLHG